MSFTVLPNGRNQFVTETGIPAVGYKVYAYVAGTSTPKDTYTDYTGGTANTHPIVLDSRGEAAIYWNGTYDVVLKDPAGVTIWGPERVRSIDADLRADLADTSSSTLGDYLVGVKSILTGGVARTQHAKNAEFVSVDDFGAVGDGTTDNYAAFNAAIGALPDGGTLLVNSGNYRISNALSITKQITIQGVDNRTGNLSDPDLSMSSLFFYNETNGLVVTDVVATFKSIVVTGTGVGTSSHYGINVTGANSSINLENCVIQSFLIGVRGVDGDYHKLTNSTITFCTACTYFDGCYNVFMSGMTLRAEGASSYCITGTNGSSITMVGGTIESFTSFGVDLYVASSFNAFGTYYEGTGTAGICNHLSTGCSVNLIGCHAYLTVAAGWVGLDGTPAGVRVYARNNRLVWPTDTTTTYGYNFVNTDTTATYDVAGDYWDSSAGVNATYTGPSVYSGSGPVIGTGSFKIQFPPNHTSFNRPIDTTWDRLRSKVAITYSASMTPNASSGLRQVITATNGVAFTINAPTSTPTISGDQFLTITIKNTSGGALGAATWNAVFKMSAWTQPTNGFSRSITFVYNVSDGSNWVQVSQTGVDIAN